MISVVDDDKSIRASTKTLLRSVGYEAETFASADEFLGSGAVDKTHCLVLDVRMPGIDGLELQQILRDSGRHVPIIFVTAYDDDFLRRRALQSGAADVLHKPFDAGVFLAVVQRLVSRGQLLHISYEKLFKVAKASLEGRLSTRCTLLFSREECQHLYRCAGCINIFGSIICEIMRDRNRNEAKTHDA